MNETVVNIGNLEVNGSEVVQSITTILQMRLDKSHNPPRMRLDRFHNLTVSKIDPDMSSSVKTICKLAQFLTKTNSKMYEPKIYDKAINNPIHRKKWRKVIDREL